MLQGRSNGGPFTASIYLIPHICFICRRVCAPFSRGNGVVCLNQRYPRSYCMPRSCLKAFGFFLLVFGERGERGERVYIAVWPFCEMADCGHCGSRPSALRFLRKGKAGSGGVLAPSASEWSLLRPSRRALPPPPLFPFASVCVVRLSRPAAWVWGFFIDIIEHMCYHLCVLFRLSLCA